MIVLYFFVTVVFHYEKKFKIKRSKCTKKKGNERATVFCKDNLILTTTISIKIKWNPIKVCHTRSLSFGNIMHLSVYTFKTTGDNSRIIYDHFSVNNSIRHIFRFVFSFVASLFFFYYFVFVLTYPRLVKHTFCSCYSIKN